MRQGFPWRASVTKRPNLRLRDLALPDLPTAVARKKALKIANSPVAPKRVLAEKWARWRSDLAPLHGRAGSACTPYRRLPRARWFAGFRRARMWRQRILGAATVESEG
jgi:hypothetical protein